MITKKEIDFSKYSQDLKKFKPDSLSKFLVRTLRLLKANTTAYKLDFYEKTLNFLRVVGLEALSNNMHTGLIGMPTSGLKDENHDSKITQSLIGFLFQFGIIVEKEGKLQLNSKYTKWIENGIAGKIIDNMEQPEARSLTKSEKQMINDFLFIKDLVKKYRNPGGDFQFIKRNKHAWERLLTEKKLDYEVRLCETLYNLVNLKIPHKIKSPFNEDYYTESGQNAFKNFTRFAFTGYLQKINQGDNSVNILDLGCGYGNYIDAAHSIYPNASITGIEINPEVYITTKTKFEGFGNIEIINKNFFDYSVDKKFDFLLMNYVFFYFNSEEKREVIKRARNMLADNGSIIICQYISGIEDLKKEIAKKQKDYALSRRIEMYYSDKILYANTLWNDAVDTFSEAVKWEEFKSIISELNLRIESMTNADRFYYSLFIELKKDRL